MAIFSTFISGLDPAKPYFDISAEELRIQSTDAEFVDIIHTNSGQIWEAAVSFPEPLGQVDFYPCGGTHQCGCRDLCIWESCIGFDLIDFFKSKWNKIEHFYLIHSKLNYRNTFHLMIK